MKIYIAYKFTGSDKLQLRKNLEQLSSAVDSLGNETFIFNRDVQKWGETGLPNEQIMQRAFKEIKAVDMLLALVDSSETSEGMLLEIGYAKGLGKKVVVCIRKGVEVSYLRSIGDFVIDYEDLDDLQMKIKPALNTHLTL